MTKLKLRSRIGKKGKSVKKTFLVYFVIGIVIVQVVIIKPAQSSSVSSIQILTWIASAARKSMHKVIRSPNGPGLVKRCI